ncbi:MAG: hypothetical protein WAU54_06000 [Chania sp.]
MTISIKFGPVHRYHNSFPFSDDERHPVAEEVRQTQGRIAEQAVNLLDGMFALKIVSTKSEISSIEEIRVKSLTPF